MRILGIDPGLQRTGYCVVELPARGLEPRLVEAGLIRLRRTDPLERRLRVLDADLQGLFEAHRPEHMAVEGVFAHYAHPRTAILMAHARGVILLAGARHGCTLVTLAPAEAKKAICGSGAASKAQVQRAVAAQFRLAAPPEPADVADAMAIAACAARRLALGRLTAKARA